MKKFNLMVPLIILMILSCGKVHDNLSESVSNVKGELTVESARLAFTHILSKAVVAEFEVRSFLKKEALKMKDNDFDVIYAFCKNDVILNGKTFKEVLIEYENYEGEIDKIEQIIPTLTILIPSLIADSFSASTWDTKTDIPFVTTNVLNKQTVVYDGLLMGNLENDEIPATAVLVVKENERIKIPMSRSLNITSESFEFVNEAFNGGRGSRIPEYVPVKYTNRNKFDFEISDKIVKGFNEFPTGGGGWQRDYIYYGLKNEPNTKGPLNRSYYECISAIKITESGLALMMDQDDPRYNQEDNFENSSTPGRNLRGAAKFWTDGNFEIQIDVLINDLNGAGASYSTVLSVPPDQLFDAEYSQMIISEGGRLGKTYVYRKLIKLHPKFYYCHIPIKEWDLEKMGSSWKISVRENDDNTIITTSETISSKVATNFGIDYNWDILEKLKLGLKFGNSIEDTSTQQVSIQRTKSNDFLGDAIVNFWDAILRTNNPVSASNIGFVVDLKSLDRRLSAKNYINVVEYNPISQSISSLSYAVEQANIKAQAKNRYELGSFNPIVNNNYEIIMLPVYKY